MNIKITKEEHDRLCTFHFEEFVIGSKLYGNASEKSDTDLLRIFTQPPEWSQYDYLDCQHQFQYDDVDNNTQYIWTNNTQFIRNLITGDSTINAEVILYHDMNIPDDDKIAYLRTYKIMKAFLGFAKRDLKNFKGRNKRFHVARGLYIVKCLMIGQLPDTEKIKTLGNATKEEYVETERYLRHKMNEQYDAGEIPLYTLPIVKDPLLQKRIDSINIKEFKYGNGFQKI